METGIDVSQMDQRTQDQLFQALLHLRSKNVGDAVQPPLPVPAVGEPGAMFGIARPMEEGELVQTPPDSSQPPARPATARNRQNAAARADRPPRPTPDRVLLAQLEGSDKQRAAAADWIRKALDWNSVPMDALSCVSGSTANATPPAIPPSGERMIAWEPRAGVRACLWFCEDSTRSPADLLTLAYLMGCRIYVSTPMADMPPQPNYADFTPLPGKQSLRRTALRQYLQNLETLFARPHARAAFLEGGILWRIAVEWAPRWQVDMLWEAVSPAGRIEFNPVKGGAQYALSQNEIDTLMGLTTEGTQIWPPPEFWNRYDKWLGQWTPGNEAWFVQQARNIRAGSLTPKSLSKWRSQLRMRTLEAENVSDVPGSAAEAEWIVNTVEREFPQALDDLDFSRL